LRNSSGSLAIFAAIRRASCLNAAWSMETAYCFYRPDQAIPSRAIEFAFTTCSDGRDLPNADDWKPYNNAKALSIGEEGMSAELVELEREIPRGLRTCGYYITTPEIAVTRITFADRRSGSSSKRLSAMIAQRRTNTTSLFAD
jgi:hypothetical protein